MPLEGSGFQRCFYQRSFIGMLDEGFESLDYHCLEEYPLEEPPGENQ
jgi:hypothetical protein